MRRLAHAVSRRCFSSVRSLREAAAAATSVAGLDLGKSTELMCNNLMCENVGERCACRLALWFHTHAMPNLETLSLARNDLRFLPEAIFDMPKLRMLDVSANRLEALPAAVARLDRLEALHLHSNALSKLPLELFDLPRLETIRVDGNAASLAPPPGDHRWEASDDGAVLTRRRPP
ncbi:hypothetical protein M885DRAFT_531387 [Pelagophyceae sp. CCMP2097]|nr:hypothetical protein M885DRAFT_531387 [Pelagophyceae sp. CCMP2097]